MPTSAKHFQVVLSFKVDKELNYDVCDVEDELNNLIRRANRFDAFYDFGKVLQVHEVLRDGAAVDQLHQFGFKKRKKRRKSRG